MDSRRGVNGSLRCLFGISQETQTIQLSSGNPFTNNTITHSLSLSLSLSRVIITGQVPIASRDTIEDVGQHTSYAVDCVACISSVR